MKLIKVAAGVLNQTPLDWTGNQARILAAIEQARSKKATILCLPELCITGYGCEDAFHSMNTVRRAWQSLQTVMPALIRKIHLAKLLDEKRFDLIIKDFNKRPFNNSNVEKTEKTEITNLIHNKETFPLVDDR